MIVFRSQRRRGLTVGRSAVRKSYFPYVLLWVRRFSLGRRTCAQLHTEMLAAAKVYQTCVDDTHGPCTNQKLTWLALVASANGTCNPEAWVLSAMQPDIKEGGRANTIAVNPTDDKTILVVSESGGMFRSADRGGTWVHVDTLPVLRPTPSLTCHPIRASSSRLRRLTMARPTAAASGAAPTAEPTELGSGSRRPSWRFRTDERHGNLHRARYRRDLRREQLRPLCQPGSGCALVSVAAVFRRRSLGRHSARPERRTCLGRW